MTVPLELEVKLNDKPIASLVHDQESQLLNWRYHDDWIKNGFAVSPHLPLLPEQDHYKVQRFLENLFPEGEALNILLEQFRINRRNIFATLKLIGTETTGALQFSVPTEVTNTSLREVSQQELYARLEQRQVQNLLVWDNKPRLSVAGVQDKLPMTMLADGRMGFGEGQLASTHILKFQQQHVRFPFIVLNEYCCLQLASALQLPVCEAAYQAHQKHPILVVKRFDRQMMSEREVKRLHIIDGCQALDLSPSYKYERQLGSGRDVKHIRDGVSLQKLFVFANDTVIPVQTKAQMLRWVLFNLLIGNADAHGKNLSCFVAKRGIRLTPFYDLVSTAVYPDVEQSMAMAIGDVFEASDIAAYQLVEFAELCQLPKRLVYLELKQLLKKFPTAWQKVKAMLPNLMPEEQAFIQQLEAVFIRNQSQYARIVNDFLSVASL